MDQDAIIGVVGGILSTVCVQVVRKLHRDSRIKKRETTEVAKAEIDADQLDKQHLWKRVERLEGRVEALEHERTELLLQLAAKDGVISALTGKIREVKDDREVQDEHIRDLETQNQELRERIDKLQGKAATQ